MRRLVGSAVVAIVLLLPGTGSPQTGALNKDPTDILKQYLKLDAHGARLQPLSSESQKPYVTWKEEPAWGHVVVITEYQIPKEVADWEVRGNLDVVVPVDFTVVGLMYWERASFLPEKKVERVPFHIKGINGLWRLVDPIIPPHVDQKRLLKFVQEAMLNETDVQRLDRLTELRNDLRKAR